MARILVKNGHQKDTCHREIVCVSIIDTILSLKVHTFGREGLHDRLKGKKIFT